jgi:hypothetical protein
MTGSRNAMEPAPRSCWSSTSPARARESQMMVRVGALLAEASPLDAVAVAVSDGHLSLDAAEAIRSGSARVDDTVPAELITAAAESLIRDATMLTVEKLASRAREWAAELDEAHVQDREQALRDARYLRLSPLPNGKDRGRTDIKDGVLLCTHHHLLIHDHGWQVTRTGAEYFLMPPATLDSSRRPIPAPVTTSMVKRAIAAGEQRGGQSDGAGAEHRRRYRCRVGASGSPRTRRAG